MEDRKSCAAPDTADVLMHDSEVKLTLFSNSKWGL